MIILIILAIIVAVLLGLVVLIQNPKGGGLGSGFGNVGNQIFGAQRSTDVVEKATWYLSIALLVLCLGSAWMTKSTSKKVVPQKVESAVEKNIDKYKNLPQMPAAPGNPAQTPPPAK